MKRYAGVMTFDIVTDDNDQAFERVRELQRKITTASRRLGIGYRQGTVLCQAQPGPMPPKPEPCPDDPGALFDDGVI